MIRNLKEKFIGDRKFYRNLLVLIFPIIIQQGITSFISLVDNIMVGQLGTESMSGVAIVNQLLFVFNLTIFGGISGASIYGAQYYGKGDNNGVRYAFRYKLIYSFLIVLVAIGILFFWQDSLISMFLSQSEAGNDLAYTLSEGKIYLGVMLIGLLPFAITQSYSSSLRETGETFTPMLASFFAIFSNLILNYILIYGHFGAPKLDVFGAAVATVISRYLEMVILICITHLRASRFEFIRGAYKSLAIPFDIVIKLTITAVPLFLNELFWSLGTTMVNQCYSTHGIHVVAATNITNTVWNLFCIIMFAMGSAVSIIVGQQLGAGQIEEAKKTDTKLIFFSVVVHIVVGWLIIASSPFIPQIYDTEVVVKELATQLMIVCGLALPIHAFTHVTYFTIRCGGKTLLTFVFDSVYTWCVTVMIAFVLCYFTKLPILLVYACVQFSDLIKGIIGFFLIKSGIWANNIVKDHVN